jgi:hypothetical protein
VNELALNFANSSESIFGEIKIPGCELSQVEPRSNEFFVFYCLLGIDCR